jgi:hypothetical protein
MQQGLCTMPFIIRLYSLAHSPDILYPNKFLKSFDPDGNGGAGQYDTALDPKDAQFFKSTKDAIDVWRSSSKTRPYRPDGESNRPLTAFNIEIVEI